MKPGAWTKRRLSGVLLLELVISVSIGVVVLGVLTYASIGISRSLSATERFIIGVANENRLMDYVAADLRRAVRVSVVSGGTTTVLKNTGATTYNIAGSTVLVIRVPDYYGSNSPNNSAGSAYKTTRYSRTTLNTSSTYNGNANPLLNGIVPWTDAQTVVGGKNVTRFAPSAAGTGEIEVRYYRGTRSGSDATPCFFRSEYPAGSSTPTSTVEIAERISDGRSTTALIVSARNDGKVFRLESSFTPNFSRSGVSAAFTAGIAEVSIRNPRRD